MAEAHIQLRSEGCGNTVTFPFSDAGTVQECPECGGYLDIPEAARDPTANDPHLLKYQEQVREVDRQQATVLRQQEQYQRQLDFFDRVAARQDANAVRLGQLIDRWHALAERLERLFSNLEQRGQS
jgi:hypothetical protein